MTPNYAHIGQIYTLPSGNIIKVTQVDQDDGEPIPLVKGVYRKSDDPWMKRLEVRQDWLEQHARRFT